MRKAKLGDLIVFDSRQLDMDTRRELERILPALIHVRRAWRAHYAEFGCVACHKKKPWYGAGGFCVACYGKISQRMKSRYRKLMAGRDLAAELAEFTLSLSKKFTTAQRLLNGEPLTRASQCEQLEG